MIIMKMLKSLKLKKFIQFMSLVLFPITINFFSPYVIIMAATEGIVNGSMILFTILLIGSVFLGRLFCSTLCPGGAVGDCLSAVRVSPVKNGRYNLIKWFIWVPWLLGISFAMFFAGGIKVIHPLYATENGISVDAPEKYIIYLGVLMIFILVNMAVGKRAMCHYGCWMAPFMIIGIKIRQLLRLPGLTLKVEENSCISCHKCTKACPMSLDVEKMVSDNKMTHIECTLCGSCVDTCPKKIISYSVKKG